MFFSLEPFAFWGFRGFRFFLVLGTLGFMVFSGFLGCWLCFGVFGVFGFWGFGFWGFRVQVLMFRVWSLGFTSGYHGQLSTWCKSTNKGIAVL